MRYRVERTITQEIYVLANDEFQATHVACESPEECWTELSSENSDWEVTPAEGEAGY